MQATRKHFWGLIALASIGLTLARHAAHPADAQPASAAPTPGVFRGRVTTAAGAPVAGAQISLHGLTAAGNMTDLDVYTKADGTYSTHLPPGNYQIKYAWALISDSAGAHLGRLPLATDLVNTSSQDISSGIVANLRFLIQGRTALGTDPADGHAYYGFHINLLPEGRFASGFPGGFPTGSSVELTLVPQGPLEDGTTGQTLVLKEAPPDAGNYWGRPQFLDIPLGRYSVSGRLLKADGTAEALQLALGGTTAYQNSVLVNFPVGDAATVPNEGGSGEVMLLAE